MISALLKRYAPGCTAPGCTAPACTALLAALLPIPARAQVESTAAAPWLSALLIGALVALSVYLVIALRRQQSRFTAQAVRLQELEERGQAAIKANDAKNQFLGRMSHALRTPLNVILGFAQIQKSKMPTDAPAYMVRNTEETLTAGWQLLNLIDDILDITRLEQQALSVSLEDCKLSEVVAHAASLVAAEAEEADITLDIEDSPLVVRADYTRLKQVLVNLLSNAIKYNTAGGKVRFQARAEDDGTVVCSVIDTGVGIEEADRERVFEAFTRLGYAEQEQIAGTGMGLALARFLSELMEGRIDFSSEPGRGSTFNLYLQASSAQAADVTSAITAAETAAPAAPPSSPLTVIYVEDHRASLELMKAIMDPLEHVTLLTATAAEEGIELALQHQPDLILLDINLIGMDGVTAARAIKGMPELSQIPLVALSADAIESNIQEAMSAGFTEYLTKPLDIDVLWRLIESLQSEGTP
ncbi:MAG: ATP-binding protein [Halieaceae bacterium]